MLGWDARIRNGSEVCGDRWAGDALRPAGMGAAPSLCHMPWCRAGISCPL